MNGKGKSKGMKVIEDLTVKHVISEPGDCTKYDYVYYRNDDDYFFMPIKYSFKYPQLINYWNIKNVTGINEIVANIAINYKCNPNTVMECIRTIQEDRKV